MKSLGVLLALLLMAAAPAAGVRHLTYAYAVYPTARVEAPVTTFTGTGTGTMDVSILGQADDGGTLIEARDWRWNEPRPEGTARCEVDVTFEFRCASYSTLSDAQTVLLPLLAKDFYAQKDSWQRTYAYSYGNRTAKATIDYASAKGGDDLVNIMAQGTYVIPFMYSRTLHDKTSIAYDTVSGLPVLVHNTTTGTTGAIFPSRSVDLKLVSDSANPTP